MVLWRGASPVSFMRSTSSRRLANERNRVSKKVISTIHWLSATSSATPPATMRSTKPKATMHTSSTAYCFSFEQ